MRMRKYINGIEGVAPGGIANVNVPVNRRYHQISLRVTGDVSGSAETDPANLVKNVRVLVNSILMRELTPDQIRNIAKLNGITPRDNEIPIYFSEPWRASVTGEEATSWDLFGQVKCVIEVEFETGITSPALKAVASYDFDRNVAGEEPFLSIVKQLKQTYNAPAGDYDVNSLVTRFPIQRLHFIPSSGSISAIDVTRDNEQVLDIAKQENADFLSDYGYDPTAFEFPVLFDYEQQITSPLKVARELNVKVTSSASNQLTVIQEIRANGYV